MHIRFLICWVLRCVVVAVIPLTQKLKECGVFGVSSGEYLEYARRNRDEWEEKVRVPLWAIQGYYTLRHTNHKYNSHFRFQGEAVVAAMVEECHEKYGVKVSESQQQSLFQSA